MYIKKWRLLNELEEGADLPGDVVEEVVADEPEEAADEPESEEVVVTIGDEPAPEETEKAPEWVRDLRKQSREDKKRLREMEAELSRLKAPEPAKSLGKKPTLDDFDYDADKFELALTTWHDQKRKVEEEANKAAESAKAQDKAWADRLAEYGEMRAALKVPDFDEAEAAVQDSFSVTQQGILVKGADNPALIVVALKNNPKKLKELADIEDPVKFAFALAKLESQLKVTNRKPPPAPEKVVTGSGRSSASVDNQLDRLRSDAEKSGDYSKVLAYKAKLKKK